MTTSEPTLLSFSWLTASAIMHDIPSVVSSKQLRPPSREATRKSTASALPYVVDEADVLLLVPDAHDPVGATDCWSRRRGAKWSASGSCLPSTRSAPTEGLAHRDLNDALPLCEPGPTYPLALPRRSLLHMSMYTRLAQRSVSLLSLVGLPSVGKGT
ncbi:hypothetical protein EDB83DRAFT_2449981 [Lactarius deliciosus]|nr:hypothetical protein EDB83DRAFT_2449981 [Lactarius deliciosus]